MTVAIALLSSGWASAAIFNLIEYMFYKKGKPAYALTIIYVMIFLLSALLVYLQRHMFYRPRTRHLRDIEDPEKRKHLVLFLSELDMRPMKFKEGIPEGLALTDDLDADLDNMLRLKNASPPIRWKWEMPLRALRHHIGILESATIVCSKESMTQSHWFLSICSRYDKLKEIQFYLLVKDPPHWIASTVKPKKEYNAWYFESFDELSEAMWLLLKQLRRVGIAEKEIMIDFTGGQKVTSVVAAAITFNRKLKAQYVQTEGDCNVLSYDVLLGSSDTGRLGS